MKSRPAVPAPIATSRRRTPAPRGRRSTRRERRSAISPATRKREGPPIAPTSSGTRGATARAVVKTRCSGRTRRHIDGTGVEQRPHRPVRLAQARRRRSADASRPNCASIARWPTEKRRRRTPLRQLVQRRQLLRDQQGIAQRHVRDARREPDAASRAPPPPADARVAMVDLVDAEHGVDRRVVGARIAAITSSAVASGTARRSPSRPGSPRDSYHPSRDWRESTEAARRLAGRRRSAAGGVRIVVRWRVSGPPEACQRRTSRAPPAACYSIQERARWSAMRMCCSGTAGESSGLRAVFVTRRSSSASAAGCTLTPSRASR